MQTKPYFKIGPESFEKNAGYKSTVHAIAEIVDNSVEAGANEVAVVLMCTKDYRLQKIAIIDNGMGMTAENIHDAVCEKSGTNLERQNGCVATGRKKFGKYGVGLPKASISQCNKFSVISRKASHNEFYRNFVNIKDLDWISAGAEVLPSQPTSAPTDWLECVGLQDAESISMVLWEDLDGITYSRAYWGTGGLTPNLAFELGRTYRKFLQAEAEDALKLTIFIVDENLKEIKPQKRVEPNDPLYITKGAPVPREKLNDGTEWPSTDPLFDDITGKDNYIEVRHPRNADEILKVTWRRAVALRDTFAKLGGKHAGNLKHGEHAGKNVGLSLLREGREVELSQALSAPSEPRERWFGVEFDFPEELDGVLGMTNNKQGYTRLNRVLNQEQSDYIAKGESTDQCLRRIDEEDKDLGICLKIAWKIQEVWKQTKDDHMNQRIKQKDDGNPGPVGGEDKDPPEPPSPSDDSESTATDGDGGPVEPPSTDPKEHREKIVADLLKGGVPKDQAEDIADRVVHKGLRYIIEVYQDLGTPFFGVESIVDAKVVQLNKAHPVFNYLLNEQGIEGLDEDGLQDKCREMQTTIFLMLEAWASVESQAVLEEKRKIMRMREDWGRKLEDFVEQLEKRKGLR